MLFLSQTNSKNSLPETGDTTGNSGTSLEMAQIREAILVFEDGTGFYRKQQLDKAEGFRKMKRVH